MIERHQSFGKVLKGLSSGALSEYNLEEHKGNELQALSMNRLTPSVGDLPKA